MQSITHTPYDLVVVGGGIAGSMAAVAAGREGLSVLLIEEEGYLGGSLTACGTGPMMTFHAGQTQVVRGLTDEMIQRLVHKGLSVGHIADSTGYTYSVTPFDSEGMKRELELMCLEAGVQLLFHTTVVEANPQKAILSSIKCLCAGNLFSVQGSYFIDASGDADLIAMAGIPYEQGRETDGKDQPLTMNFKLVDVDLQIIRNLMDSDIELFPFLIPKAGLQHQASRLSFSGFQQIMYEGIEKGEITFDRDIVLCFETNAKNEVIVNMTRVLDKNPVKPLELTAAELEGRRQVWELYGFLKTHIPGFEHARMTSSGPRIGVRSSRRLKGLYRVTAKDLLNETIFDDAISACGYPIDIHSPDGAATDSTFLREGGFYTIPLRSLLNAQVPNVLAAGRNISCEFAAHASLRVSPSAGAIGQGAGTAVALAVKTKTDLFHLDLEALHATLRKAGAFIG
ncbi:FAD-dependent oxidoreductase [Sphaerochaeta globosa]|uniref:Fumarate reductase/succinate dehydrogenase flavoprotein domain protein n=1 Tax=Sphaerochaeta globosa (strain ATCC BAA-1886 / DSM 22777 / Buddy) TaxID=158189 RepID=F0RUA2_SPHGB|nr:FAD-dependent oxidoreductase [Sphaerochaeta globosa]ADY12264.1 fumarate reductase/succinate dehydrogenase flavoprotein domain protein [Sphaerochaeta globosa str. Buddy]